MTWSEKGSRFITRSDDINYVERCSIIVFTLEPGPTEDVNTCILYPHHSGSKVQLSISCAQTLTTPLNVFHYLNQQPLQVASS